MSRHRADVVEAPPSLPERVGTRLPRPVGPILTVLSFVVVLLTAGCLLVAYLLEHRAHLDAAAAADSASSRLSAAVASLSAERGTIATCRTQLSRARADRDALAKALPSLQAAYDTGDTATFQNTLAALKPAALKGC